MTDGTTITTTEYMDGFQYTNNVLDFFPHPEGYVKALPAGLGGGSSYQFKYVFTYTDHLGNIRLKYAQDPSNNNRISILEEDHYYPYGLKHSGYNSFHQIFATEDGDGTGTGIVLTPVNPFLGDSHKYKFGGKEYQDEFDVNTYDFGARNYDPALARWMNLDPLAELMRRHSPYNYAFNNPVYFIDPDGMSPLPVAVTSIGMGVDGVKDIGAGGSGGFDVRTYDRDGNTLDSVTVNSNQGVDINADGDITKNDLQTPGDGESNMGGADMGLDDNGGDPVKRPEPKGMDRNYQVEGKRWVEINGRWTIVNEKKEILQWDSKKGEVEVYKGKKHLGGYDPLDRSRQISKAIPKRIPNGGWKMPSHKSFNKNKLLSPSNISNGVIKTHPVLRFFELFIPIVPMTDSQMNSQYNQKQQM